MKKSQPRGFRGYDTARKTATFEFIVPGTAGRKRVRRSYAVSCYADVWTKGPEFREEMLRRFGVKRGVPTFREYVDSEWESMKRRTTSRRQVTNRSLLDRHLVPHFGAVRLDRINDGHVEDFVLGMKHKDRTDGKEGYSAGYINSGLSLLRTILRHATRRSVIGEYPLRDALPLLPEPKLRNELNREEEMRFLCAFSDQNGFRRHLLGRSNLGRVISSPHFATPRRFGGGMKPESDAARDYFERFSESRPLFLAALHTGLRMDDLRHLRWSEVNLHDGLITVQMRKTHEVATIPVSPELRHSLLALRGKELGTEYVYVTREGKVFSVTTINRYFVLAKELSGITRRFRFHDLRHTFASKLAAAGVSLGVIRRCLGHTSARMAERYAFPSDEAVRDVVRALAFTSARRDDIDHRDV